MNTSTHISSAERMGGALGRLWKKWLRLNDKISNRLATYGIPAVLTKIALLVIKLIVLGALFYAAFWVTVLLLLGAAITGMARYGGAGTIDIKPEKIEYRDGHSGIGLYNKYDLRVDPGEPYEG